MKLALLLALGIACAVVLPLLAWAAVVCERAKAGEGSGGMA